MVQANLWFKVQAKVPSRKISKCMARLSAKVILINYYCKNWFVELLAFIYEDYDY